MAFEAHGSVDEEAQTFSEAVMAVLSEELQDTVEGFRLVLVGHVMCVWRHPNKKPTWLALDQFFTGVKLEGRRAIHRNGFTPTTVLLCLLMDLQSGRTGISV